MEKLWISNIITENTIKSWNPLVPVFITSGVGTGKTTLITGKIKGKSSDRHSLYKYVKEIGGKILVLVPRLSLYKKYKKDIQGEEDVIDLFTYQKIDNDEAIGYHHDFSKYSHIVADECHYFIDDSTFNDKTEYSFNKIIESDNAVKIFMSATSDDVRKYVQEIYGPTQPYGIKPTWERIQDLVFYKSNKQLPEIAEEILQEGSKAVFFINKIDDAVNLYEQYKDCSIFNCSEYRREYANVDKDKIASLIENEGFDCNFLITTTAMDCGLNFKDPEIKHIIVDVKDVNALMQCIGRKRIESVDDRFTLYVKDYDNNALGGFMSRDKEQIRLADKLEHEGSDAYYDDVFLKEQDAQNKPGFQTKNRVVRIVKDGKGNLKFEVNKLRYAKYKAERNLWWKMMHPTPDQKEKHGWSRYIATILEKYEYEEDRTRWLYKVRHFEIDKEKSKREKIYAQMKEWYDSGTEFSVEDRKQIHNLIIVYDEDKKNRLKNIDSLNGKLAGYRIPYRLKEDTKRPKNKNGKRTKKVFWRIECHEKEK